MQTHQSGVLKLLTTNRSERLWALERRQREREERKDESFCALKALASKGSAGPAMYIRWHLANPPSSSQNVGRWKTTHVFLLGWMLRKPPSSFVSLLALSPLLLPKSSSVPQNKWYNNRNNGCCRCHMHAPVSASATHCLVPRGKRALALPMGCFASNVCWIVQRAPLECSSAPKDSNHNAVTWLLEPPVPTQSPTDFKRAMHTYCSSQDMLDCRASVSPSKKKKIKLSFWYSATTLFHLPTSVTKAAIYSLNV